MAVPTKLGLYALGLVAAFAAAFGTGALAGPALDDSYAPTESAPHGVDGSPDTDPHDDPAGH